MTFACDVVPMLEIGRRSLGIGVPSRHPYPYPHHPFPPINRWGEGGGVHNSVGGVGAGMSSALWLTPPHASTPECPFSAERGLSRTSRERRERGLYLGRLQVEVPYHGVARSPLRGRVSPPAGVRVSPNGGFDFPQRGVSPPPTEQGISSLGAADDESGR